MRSLRISCICSKTDCHADCDGKRETTSQRSYGVWRAWTTRSNLGSYLGADGSIKLPANTLIARDKLTRYLLVLQARGDKSAFWAKPGYTLENADQLLNDLRD